MTRRQLLSSVAAAATASALFSSPEPGTGGSFPGTPFRQYSRCLPGYLAVLAKNSIAVRERQISLLTNVRSIRARQLWVRDTLRSLVGPFPESTPLNARLCGRLDRPAYQVEKISYESSPKLFVSANLYIPRKGPGPFPAILFQVGHYWDAKAYPPYQRCCQGLAQLGFLVLAFDPMGEGERVAYLDHNRRSRLHHLDDQHTMPGRQMLLFGDTATRFQLWDAIRSLDYLLSRPEADHTRVASFGHSGGGTMTMFLAALDDRLTAAAVCMGNTENFASLPFHAPGATDDAENDLIYAAPLGFDRWDLFYPFAPKPMLVWPSDSDFFGEYSPSYINNGWREYRQLKNTYALLGHSPNLAWADTPLPHALAYDSRLLAYNWFNRCFHRDAQAITEEPPVHPEPASSLWVTESGNVSLSFGSETAFSLNAARHNPHTSKSLARLLRLDSLRLSPTATRIARLTSPHFSTEVFQLQTDPGVWLAIWLFTPHQSQRQQVLLALDPAGVNRLWLRGDIDDTVPANAPVICAVDIRGIGSQAPAFSSGAPGYAQVHQDENNYAWASLILGKPLVTQRVTDILAVLHFLAAYPPAANFSVRLAAEGQLTVPALFATALHGTIRELYLARGLVSFRKLVETEIYSHPLSNIIPAFLNSTDLPELVAELAPRKVVLAGPVDANGIAVSLAEADRIYALATQAGHLTIQEDPDWSARSLCRA